MRRSLDIDLVRRYDQRGPRYTSYPTARQFHTGFGAQDYRRAALLSNAAHAKPLSAYVHVPFCASPCFYCGCNKIITRERRHAADYVRRLLREIELQGRLFDRSRVMEQLHFGGGTPTFLKISQLSEILDQLAESFHVSQADSRELSIEIDPRTVGAETFPGLAMLGFNRVSLGVQDFDPHVQRAINRLQTAGEVEDCVRFARATGFRSVSFDLIYGLPLQTIDTFARTLDAAIRMQPDRLAVYGYAHMPEVFKPQRALNAAALPSPELRLQLLALTVERLTAAGYVHIGMDHFALPNDAMTVALRNGTLHRNFQGYSTHAECDLIGLGVSAIGSTGSAYSQNHKQLPSYYRALDQGALPIERGISLSVDDMIRRDVIQSIMCTGVVDWKVLGNKFAVDPAGYFARELHELDAMANDGLLQTDQLMRVSESGRFLLRNIAMVFDAYLRAAAVPAYSNVI